MTNKDAIAHAVLQQESLFKVSFLLDQFNEGLKKVKLLPLIEAFSDLFQELFTFTGNVDHKDVLSVIECDEVEPADTVAIGHLERFIRNASSESRLFV